jgi:undecaprenyl diphosphate synthase
MSLPSVQGDIGVLRIPRHVAIIMDGNGRWAKSQGKLRWDGHSAGADSVRDTVEAARRMGIEYLTLYAFSVNNWSRPRLEVEALMRLLSLFAKREQAELVRQGIVVKVAGSLDAFPSSTRRAVEGLIEATKHGTGMTLTLALSYGGRTDLMKAVESLARDVAEGRARPEDVSEAALRSRMSTSHLPDVDLLIRTGGETRISDFLLYESAYAELCFLPVMWPEFREAHLQLAVEQFNGKERRFGLTSEQVEAGEVVRIGAR